MTVQVVIVERLRDHPFLREASVFSVRKPVTELEQNKNIWVPVMGPGGHSYDHGSRHRDSVRHRHLCTNANQFCE